MIPQELLNFLYKNNVVIDLDGEDLLVDAPENFLDDNLIGLLTQHKSDIIQILKKFNKVGDSSQVIKHAHIAPYTSQTSLAQERMLFLEELAGNNSYYNLPFAYKVYGSLNKPVLVKAFASLIDNHEILRTTYQRAGADYIQLIHSKKNIPFNEIDLSFVDDKPLKLSVLLEADANYQFELNNEWPIRINLITLSDIESIISINIHHIAADGLSAKRILGDLSEAYDWFLTNPETENFLRYDGEYQYSDYAKWQKSWIGSPDYNASQDYWIARLNKAPHLHSVPTDFVRPNEQSTAGDFYADKIPQSLNHKLTIAARSTQTTPFIFFQTAFAALLSRYSGETDVVFGIASANRYPTVFINSIGLFVNTLAMRYQLSENPSFSTLLSQAITINDSAVKHQGFPFDALVDYLQPQRGLSYNPLVQIMLVMHDGAANNLQLQNVEIESVIQKQKVSKFDFSLHITPQQDNFFLEWEYNTDLFKPQTIELMSSHFIRLLEALIETPDTIINKLPLINDNEIPKTIDKDIFPPVDCVHHLIEKKVFEYPDAIAIIDGDKQFTYHELNESANNLAAHLAANGNIKRVGVCLNKSAEMIIAFFAILKMGAVYVPLDPQYPKERLEFMINDSGMDVLLINSQSNIDLNIPVPVLRVSDLLNSATHDFTSVTFNPESPAYIIYTSGSTGKPKGVLVSHKSLFYSLIANKSLMQISNTDTMPTIGSQAFGVSLLEILLPLISGGTVLVLQKSDILNIDLLTHLTNKVTVLHAVPSLMRIWLDLLIEKGGSHSYPNLRLLLVGGEAVPDKLLKDIKSWRSHVRLLELYGMTELAVVCSSYDMTNGSTINYCIGKPHPNTEFYVLNEDLQHQPIGIPGELHIGGLSLATEYIGQPGITSEKFIVNPFDTTQRLYKSGDRVKRLADGHYEFLGRVDFQVSVRGVRIECGEIEALTLQVDGVKQAVAHVFDTQTDNQVLTLYFTLFSEDLDQADIADNIRAHLNHYLPDYMIPSIIQKIDTFPLNPNGKVDRKSLPAPDVSQYQKTYVAPRTDIEKIVGDMWQEVLGVERVGITDNFFQLGGHSLSATRLVARINQTLNINLPLRTLFTAATLESLAVAISALEKNVAAVSLKKIPREQTLQPSFAQQRLWLLDQIEGGSAHYNLTGGLSLSGPLDYKALNEAFNSIVERHESLRTCFAVGDDGQPLQIIQAAKPFSISIIDLSELAEGTRELKKAELILEEARYIFNLRSDVMVRATLLKLAANEHLLLATMHHIASDGWSLSILLNELCVLYSAYNEGKVNPLNPLPIQYADYAHWQRSWLQGDILEHQLGYWTKQLSNLPISHSLPLDNPRPVQQSFVGDIYNSQIDSATLGTLDQICHSQGATLFMGLHAAFSVLLSRYSNEKDIVVGSPIANREQAEIADLIGFFVNTLVLRSDLSANPNFIELLNQSKTMLLDAYAHQQVPFEQIVERLQPERNLSYSPLFQVMLVLQNNAMDPLDIPGLTLSAAEQHVGIAKYDLTLYVNETAQGLTLNWEYNIDLFEADTVARMAAHFELLLKSIIANPESHVFESDILTAQEHHQLLVEWNNTKTDYPKEKSVHELFEMQATLDPHKIAIVFEEQQLTYQQLNEKANQLAHYLLQEKQVKPDSLIGICVERSLDMVIGILAILKSGGAYVPLDPEYPQARLAYMLEDANLSTVLTQHHLRAAIPVGDTQAVHLDDIEFKKHVQKCPITNPDLTQLGFSSNNLAYVIYTSGSTGNPKGVMVEHKNVVNFLATMRDKPGLASNDKLLAVTSTSFDIHGLELFLPLMTGATLIVASRAATSDPDALVALMTHHQISIMQATPATWKMLLDANWQPQSAIKILCGGEALGLHLAQALLAHQCLRLWNMYGPTETTIWSTVEEIKADDQQILMGQPIGNTQVYIAGDNLALAPIGVAGELLIGGAGVTRGYLNRRELTEEKFIVNPFYDKNNSASSKRLYRTGDLVRWLTKGKLEFLGRLDHQVKIRGFRIELGEIENALIGHANVKDAVALAKSNQAGDKHLVAYVVIENSILQEADDDFINHLRQHLGKNLPDYMVPSTFVFLEQFPLTPNGKIDRKALPEPDLSAQHIYVAPRTETEKRLCEIWQEVLGVERVGITDNFFQLGGHSLSATRLVARINQTFNIVLPLKTMFKAPTMGSLIMAMTALEKNTQVVTLEKISRDLVLQPSFAQQRLWLLDQIDGGSAHYNMPGGLQLSGKLNYDALDATFSSIIERHESLRTCFAAGDDGQPIQIIQSALPFKTRLTDLSALAEDARNLQKNQRIIAAASHVFDLRKDVMLRAELLKMTEDEHFLLVTMHHIASDGWSMEILINEFSVLYRAYVQGKENPLPPLTIQYADYAHWQRNIMQGEVLEQELDYWTKQLAGLPVVHALPLDHPRPAIQSFAGATHSSQIDSAISKKLNNLCQTQGATLFMGLHAVFSVLLSRYSNETDIVIGSPIANREQVEVADLIGFFVNTLVLRSDLSERPSFTSLLNQSKTMLLDAYAHQQLPFEQIVEYLQPERSLSHSALFQIMLVLQNNEQGSLELPGLTLSSVEQSTTSISKYDLTLNVLESDGGLQLDWEYNTDLFESQTISKMAMHFDFLLTSLLQAPNENVFKANMLSAQEHQQQLVDWNNTHTDYPHDKCIHQLFEAQVESNPDVIAVVFEKQILSYQQLNEKANQLAHYLIQEKHVKADTLVGICVERSLDMVVGILAILKAGGAYVPMDPDYPETRLQYMLDDAQLGTVLTQGHLQKITPLSDTQAVCLDSNTLKQDLQKYPTSNPEVNLTSSQLAYVIYTSGSTGNPKGVLVEHTSVVRLVKESNYIELTPESVIAQASNMSFDAMTFELWGGLLNGARVVYIAKEILINAVSLQQHISQHRINTIFITTALFNSIAVDYPSALANLKYVLFGGEDCSLPLVRKMCEHGKPQHLLHVYGPTENTTFSLWKDLDSNYLASTAKVALGQSISNTTSFVLDSNNALVPVSVMGELHLGGPGLAQGYLNRPDLTAEKFIANPFYDKSNPASSERLYKTGDLVRWLPNGDLEFLGRIDHQVKIRGFRIELGEIESTLIAHPVVKEVIVLAKESAMGEKRLVAYVVANTDDSLQPETETRNPAHQELIDQLHLHVSQRLPEYMVPSAFVLLAQLPLTPNGKVDRKALPEPDISTQQQTYTAPRTQAEQTLCNMWQDVLGLERVGITDNFFQLGGHSLSAARLVARINQTFKVTLPLKTLFSTPTVEALMVAISALEQDSTRRTLEPVSRDQVLLASHVQQRYWLMDQVEGGGSLHNMPGAFKLTGALDYHTLNQVLTSILERHESLRTCFVTDAQGQLIQSIQPASLFQLAVTDLSLLEDGTRQLRQAELIAQEANQPFVLDHDLMLRAQLLKLANDDHILLLTMHHIASDGWSLGVLIHEVRELYTAYHQGLGNPLPPLVVQYADYAWWQRQEFADHHDSELQYWLTELYGAPEATPLPLDYPRHQLKTNSQGVAVTHLERSQLERFTNAIAAHNGTLFSGLFASLSLVLHRWCVQDDVVIGVVDAGRDHPDIEPLIGCFINTLAIRSKADGDESLPSFLARTCAHINDVMAHKSFPFDVLVNAINPERAVHSNPLFNVGLLLQNFSSAEVQIADLDVTQLDIERAEALLDLRFVVEESADGISISCDYRQELFSADSIGLLLEAYQSVIAQVADQFDRKLADVEIPASLLQQANLSRQRQYTLCVAGTFTLEPLADSLYFWREELGLDLNLEFTPFQQVFQQLLDTGSELRRNRNGFNLILLSLQDWVGVGDVVQQQANLQDTVQRFAGALDDAQAQSSVPYIVMVCPSMIEVCGSQQLLDVIAKQQQWLAETLQSQARVKVVLPEVLERDFGLVDYLDIHSYHVGHIPYSPAYYSAIMSKALRLFSGHQRKPYKVVVLDCDNTLWHGVCAETGAQGVQVSAGYRYLQQLALGLHAKGLLLCLCSANEADDVWAVFDQHQDMLITRKHLVSARINWEPKWQNIQSLADELNLGLDSFIFIDDDALQCAQMKEYCPQVLTLQLPVLSDDIPAFLDNVWALDVEQSSALHEDRTALYAQNNQREQLLKANNNRLEFLDSLALSIDIQTLNQNDCARAAELLLRTNQFNFTGVVVDEAELQRASATTTSGITAGITARVDDRFGSYGLVGFALLRADEANKRLQIVNMVLSCRALGRGVEYAMLNEIARIAREQQIETIQLPFTRTTRNTPALQFLQQLRSTITSQPDASTTSDDSTTLFAVEDMLRLDYRVVLEGEMANPGSGLDIVLVETASPVSLIGIGQLLTPLQYSKIAKLSQNFIALDEMIQQNAQQRQATKSSARSVEFVAPRTEIEKILCEIWQDMLKVNPIGIMDNFFQLGGNSLLAARLVRKINIDIDENFKIGSIFQFPTIEGTAQVITKNTLAKPAVVGEKYNPLINYSVPVNKLLYKNKALNVIAYHTGSIFLDIQSRSITFDLLQDAFSLLIQMHPILNSKQYVNSDGDLVHTFNYTTEKFNLVYKDFTLSTEQDAGANPWLDCDQYVTTIPGSFTFTEDDRLFKAYLFNCGEAAPKRLFIIWHHNILDGFSVETIVTDFDEIVSTLLETGSYNKQKHYTNITEWYDVISSHAKDNWTKDLNYWQSQPWNQVKHLPQDKYSDNFTTDWANVVELADMQSLWNENIVLETMQESLAKARSANRLSVEKTQTLYSTRISQQGINAFDVILLAISRVCSVWANTDTSLVEIINSGRGLIFSGFDNTRTIGDIAFNAPLLINAGIDKPALSSARKIFNERQELPRLALSYKWNKNILELPEYVDFPQSQILINYDTGNRYEAGIDLNLVNTGLMTPGYTNSNYKDISPELIAKDRVYLFIDIKDEQLFCQIEIPGYDGGVIYKNPYYHPSRVFTLGKDVITEIENILNELIKE